MTITAQEIVDLNVDGGVEEIVLELLAEITALKLILGAGAVPDSMTSGYPSGRTVVYTKTSDVG